MKLRPGAVIRAAEDCSRRNSGTITDRARRLSRHRGPGSCLEGWWSQGRFGFGRPPTGSRHHHREPRRADFAGQVRADERRMLSPEGAGPPIFPRSHNCPPFSFSRVRWKTPRLFIEEDLVSRWTTGRADVPSWAAHRAASRFRANQVSGNVPTARPLIAAVRAGCLSARSRLFSAGDLQRTGGLPKSGRRGSPRTHSSRSPRRERRNRLPERRPWRRLGLLPFCMRWSTCRTEFRRFTILVRRAGSASSRLPAW